MNRLKILHLEDSRVDTELVNYYLQKAKIDFEFKTVDTDTEYLSALEEYRPDVILSDHSLPQFDSFEALKLFKLKKLNIPFILVTGTVSEEFAVKCLKMGADDYISKANLNRLATAIKHALKKKETEKERDEAIKKLTAKIKDLDTFIYKASHDLKGPLSSMIGLINLAKHEIKDDVSLGYFNMLEQSTRNLDNILIDLLAITRINQEKISSEKIDFEKIVSDIFLSLEHLDNSKTLEFKKDIKPDIQFYGDSKMISSVLQNLVHNAINYRRMIKESFVSVKIFYTDGNLIIEVSDNGTGVPKDLQSKIFDMFYRGNTQSKGSGLGLYIVRTAIEKMLGHIDLKSEPAKGSTFRITLPYLIE
jgi:signal transduction histidine kinase